MSENPRASWLPLPHFMAMAPLDVWVRLLVRLRRVPGPRYLARIGLGLATSFVGTIVTLPERLLLAPFLFARFGRSRPRIEHEPGVLIVTGYYRTGTTHLHYLLSCDPAMTTPKWVHVAAPQGFALSWVLIRWLMIPFISNSRPQDDVAFGPEWPSEDDFALNNWCLASSLPGRFIVPSEHAFFERFHDLNRLSNRELACWRRAQAAFCWKLMALRPRKRLLLKTPSHTARLGELEAMFGRNLRVIHISREPGAVVQSNVRMAERLEPYSLEPMPSPEVIRERVMEEFVRTEFRYVESAARLGASRVCEIRFEDLVADPLGQLKNAYAQLGYDWTAEAERGFRRYLGAVRDYKPRHGTAADVEALEPALQQLATRFGHDQPAVEPVVMEHEPRRDRTALAIVATIVAAFALALLWVGIASVFRDRNELFIWVFGIVLGLVAIRTAGRGSTTLGLVSAGCLGLIILPSIYPVTVAAYSHRWPADEVAAGAMQSTLRVFKRWGDLIYVVFGLISAYRVGSRLHIRPPGS